MSALPSYSQNVTPEAASGSAPLRLVQTLEIPGTVKGNFDHFSVDLKRNRLFATPEDFKAVLVFDLGTGKIVHQIDGIVRPHAVLYRSDIDRIFVTDGGDGSVKVFDGESYGQIARIPLLKDADSIGYDISRKYLYVDNGGGDVGQTYSMLSVIDTTTNSKLADMQIEGDTLEAMALDNYRPHIYVNDKATNQVVVIDRFRNKILAKWPLTMGKQNVAIALDEQRQRLFVGCRSGQIVVLDSNTGKELQTLPISKGVDDLIYDPITRRLYASTDGVVDVFEQTDLNHYVSRGSVASGANGRTSRLVPELNRLFVAVPQAGSQNARVLVYEPINTPAPRAPLADDKEPVNAPAAQQIALETLSAHPMLRRIGLHVIPPGRENMILIANGNVTRVGIRTSDSDFAAVKSGKIYGPRIEDGQFYNMKMYLSDAQGRRIGILVMEIACTDAVSEEDAAHKAESIREEVQQKIPSLESLFMTPAAH
ncbi:MAG TPA: YncE family protein [Granulicella sp.]|nr:YncE family protein [Granulicella sp.]